MCAPARAVFDFISEINYDIDVCFTSCVAETRYILSKFYERVPVSKGNQGEAGDEFWRYGHVPAQ